MATVVQVQRLSDQPAPIEQEREDCGSEVIDAGVAVVGQHKTDVRNGDGLQGLCFFIMVKSRKVLADQTLETFNVLVTSHTGICWCPWHVIQLERVFKEPPQLAQCNASSLFILEGFQYQMAWVPCTLCSSGGAG